MKTENRTQDPDLTPQAIPPYAAVEADVENARDWLTHVAGDEDDPRQARAQQLLAVDDETGRTRLEEVALLAWRIASGQDVVIDAEIAGTSREMTELIYEFSEDAGARQSPLYLLEPTVLLEVLETAVARIWLEAGHESWTTRQLARLARVDVDVMEQVLKRDGIHSQPYGVSLSEMASMSAGDQLYWYTQYFVIGLEGAPVWLEQFPGLLPTAIEQDAAAA